MICEAISKEQGQALADEYGIKFLETSAKSNIGVEESFFSLARDIKKRLIDTPDAGKVTTGVNLDDAKTVKVLAYKYKLQKGCWLLLGEK